MSEIKGHANIPWCSAEEWNQVVLSIKRVDGLYGGKLDRVYDTAIKIRQKFEELSGPTGEICSHTCVYCEDVCCVRATIWYDLKDLLYIYFGLNTFPESQIIKKLKGNRQRICCHLSEKGCMLSRIERPFVCTWYFCSVQKKYLALHHYKTKESVDKILMDIKDLRNKMEKEFIRVSYSNL